MEYNRLEAVEYAARWAFDRNPAFTTFDFMGGDCTNFVSQCIYAGAGVMNYTPDVGWYYISLNNRSAAWTGVEFLKHFLLTNEGPGPYGHEAPLETAMPGDVVFLSFDGVTYQHSTLVVQNFYGMITISTHTNDAFNRPLYTYEYQKAFLVHIDGVNPQN